MAHYAKVFDGTVIEVIVAEQDVIDSGIFGDPSHWIQTSYNTHGGQHLLGGTPLRKNFAGVGFVYDSVRDAFYAQQPYPSWTLDEETCFWIPPMPYPNDGKPYMWSEFSHSWVEIPIGEQQ
jgi:hypothetical protein